MLPSGTLQDSGFKGQDLCRFLLVVGQVGLQAVPGQQFPPGLQPLAPRTASRLEAGLMVARFTFFTDPALLQLEREDDVFLLLTELTDEALGLAELGGSRRAASEEPA